MKTVWKFELPVTGLLTVAMPRGAHVLSAGVQGDTIVVWALIDPDAFIVEHLFAVKGTGFDITPEIEQGDFIGTVFRSQHGVPLVWHIFSLGDIGL